MRYKNVLSIEDLDKALSAMQKAIDDLSDANEQLDYFSKILFSRFGMSEDERIFEQRIKETQSNILVRKEICNACKNYVELAKDKIIACEQIDNEIAKSAEMWK